ncbi:leucyl/phenylalanyl-tRNA--protein transferase [Pollutimonas bauzanensis]|uniref:Leucyl/phenylalanyl-tRNA--protein transferase n=1 Tax=Pollutimonas bauzanensis TaxID=658167 RepID=A0A1M5X3Q9_9BURK|nr:leucyl/phenylalanyl-tRNA--protein transferase [Pollutimonas bauzanensis]SHH94232.1 leucyl/phenylalanyl-tRNA--protein transferase [Pollutimonas bauzanensis]
MTRLIWLDEATPLPHPRSAPPEGLLAAGGGLSIARLTEAYSKGIFPWFNEGEPVLWWSPDPRMVLACADFKASRSLAKKLRQVGRGERAADARIRVTTDTAFAQVMAACAAPRAIQQNTWISPAIQSAYLDWHRAGAAHSIETWMDGQLMGGVYGVNLGGFFFGESMFSRASDASKLALAYLVNFLRARGIRHIDCQQQTGHLASLGARPMSRKDFLALLEAALQGDAPAWNPGQILQSGELAPTG